MVKITNVVGGAIVVGKRIGDQSSNPGRGHLRFTLR